MRATSARSTVDIRSVLTRRLARRHGAHPPILSELVPSSARRATHTSRIDLGAWTRPKGFGLTDSGATPSTQIQKISLRMFRNQTGSNHAAGPAPPLSVVDVFHFPAGLGVDYPGVPATRCAWGPQPKHRKVPIVLLGEHSRVSAPLAPM